MRQRGIGRVRNKGSAYVELIRSYEYECQHALFNYALQMAYLFPSCVKLKLLVGARLASRKSARMTQGGLARLRLVQPHIDT